MADVTASAPNALAIRLGDRRIGVLTRLAGDRSFFAFDENYIDDSERPTLSLSFKTALGGVRAATRSFTARVPPFFSNLLPEGHLRAYLAQRAGVKPEREFYLLSALGADLPGAVIAEPLSDDAGRERQAQERSLRRLDALPALRFSLAGLQLKFSAIMEAAGGLTVPADGVGGAWIAKLPSAHFRAVPENEFVMLELARSVGIDVPALKLVPVAEIGGLPHEAAQLDGAALIAQRFDRGPDGARIHMEDFAQVFGVFPDDKYERRSYANIAAVLVAETGEDGAEDFVRRLVFSILIGNADMHLKNWSVLYRDARKPGLSPAYDFVSTIAYLADDQLALGFGGERGLGRITLDQVRRFAETAGLPVPSLWRLVGDTIAKVTEAWRTHAPRDLLPGKIGAAVTRQIERVAAATQPITRPARRA